MRKTLLVILLFITPALCVGDGLSGQIRQLLEKGPARYLQVSGHGYSAEKIDSELKKLYAQQDYQPYWVDNGGPTGRAKLLRSYLETSYEDGLIPEDYRLSAIKKYWRTRKNDELAMLDILLSLGLASYIADVSEGRIDPRYIDPKLFSEAKSVEVDLVSVASRALQTKDLENYLDSIAPSHRYYGKLRDGLQKYRKIARSGGWEPIPAGETLKAGMTDSRVSLVRMRLAITGDMQGGDLKSIVYDEELVKSVESFQERHQLEVDGKVGKATLAALNISAEDRVKQIVINMERWRWTDRDFDSRQVFVNIAGYQVLGVQGQEVEFESPVIVGKTYTKTPVFSDVIEYIEVNPYWNVPNSIAKGEYLPKLQKNPGALQPKNIKIFANWNENAQAIDPYSVDWSSVSKSEMGKYRLRQEPGKGNALGTVKIMFPNQHNVYLHDTPNHALFSKTQRTFSHGCIRVNKPHELASYVLGGAEKGWSAEKVKALVASGKREIIKLDKPVPVHILYSTAASGDDDLVRFRPDIYQRDVLLKKALFQGSQLG